MRLKMKIRAKKNSYEKLVLWHLAQSPREYRNRKACGWGVVWHIRANGLDTQKAKYL